MDLLLYQGTDTDILHAILYKGQDCGVAKAAEMCYTMKNAVNCLQAARIF